MVKRRKGAQKQDVRRPSSPLQTRGSLQTTDADADFAEDPHQVELNVQRELFAHSELRFSSLVVRRIPNGVCLEGVVEAHVNSPDVCSLAQAVLGVDEVLNHLVVRRLLAKG